MHTYIYVYISLCVHIMRRIYCVHVSTLAHAGTHSTRKSSQTMTKKQLQRLAVPRRWCVLIALRLFAWVARAKYGYGYSYGPMAVQTGV